MEPGPMPSPAEAVQPAVESASSVVGKLLHDSTEYARALGQLVASETELAKVNLVRIAIVALLVPAIAGAALLAANAWLAALLAGWTRSWPLGIGAVALINIAALAVAVWLLRAWFKTLSLPRSRAALAGLWEKP